MKRVILSAAALLTIGLLAVSCGVPQEDLDAANTARDMAAAERDAAKAELTQLKANTDQLIVYADSVRGHIPSDYGPTCALNNLFHRGEMIVWRIKIIDPETGNQVPRATSALMADQPDKDALAKLGEEATIMIHLSDGQSFPAHFGLHGNADYFWTFGWEIPADYPTGMIDVNITADWNGKSGEWTPNPIPPSLMTVLE